METNARAERTDAQAVAFRLSALGDVTLLTGVLDYWRQTRGLRFVVITRRAFTPLLENHPAVPCAIGLGAEELDNWPRTAARLAARHGGRMLVDLHVTLRSLLLMSLWRGKVHRYPKQAITRRIFQMWRPHWAEERLLRHTVTQRYALALEPTAPPAELLRPRIYLAGEELSTARNTLSSAGFNLERPIIALHPYATHDAKAWPEQQWRELIANLNDRGIQWLVTGAADVALLKDLAGPRDFTGRTSLRQACGLLASCSSLVTGDSGPMHLAAGVGTPVIALFGPTTRHWGFAPQGPLDVVLERPLNCRPCSLHGQTLCSSGQRCMKEIAARDVMQAVEATIDLPRQPWPPAS